MKPQKFFLLVTGEAICQQPMSMGSGDANLQRWYYDSINRKCVPFVYRGHYGNQNNFLSELQCQQTCAGIYSENQYPTVIFPRH